MAGLFLSFYQDLQDHFEFLLELASKFSFQYHHLRYYCPHKLIRLKWSWSDIQYRSILPLLEGL
ncbi:hypothetical protein D3C86_1959640 [compost metagenome]